MTQQPVHDADNEGGDDVESGGGLESGHQAPTPSPHVDCEEDPHRAEHFRTPAPPLLFYSAPAQQALGPLPDILGVFSFYGFRIASQQEQIHKYPPKSSI